MRLTIAIGLGLVLSACTASGPHGPVIEPGHVFPGDNLSVTWPNSEGWHLSTSRRNEWVFAKQGTAPDDTYIAVISWFRLPSAITPPDFVAFIKQRADEDIDQKRFKDLKSSVEYSDERKYPCVHYHAQATDTEPLTESGRKAPLLLQVEHFDCKNPLLTDMAFAAVYSHRGNEPDPEFQQEAADFFAGIQVPGH